MDDIVKQVRDGDLQLLDVRSKEEWRSGHAQYALHIPLNRLMNGSYDELDPAVPVVVYCASGARSGMAQAYLKQQGFTAKNIGGLGGWQALGGSIEQ